LPTIHPYPGKTVWTTSPMLSRCECHALRQTGLLGSRWQVAGYDMPDLYHTVHVKPAWHVIGTSSQIRRCNSCKGTVQSAVHHTAWLMPGL
jgi:hypothetical protein